MADNVPITAGSGTSIATDDVGGVHHQRVKLGWGPDGTANEVDTASGKAMPVQLRDSSGNALPLPAALGANGGLKIEDAQAIATTSMIRGQLGTAASPISSVAAQTLYAAQGAGNRVYIQYYRVVNRHTAELHFTISDGTILEPVTVPSMGMAIVPCWMRGAANTAWTITATTTGNWLAAADGYVSST